MAENQTNIEKADEVVGYLATTGGIPFGKASLYIGFLTSTPSLLTSFGVLVDNMKKGTATRNDYVHAFTSLAGVSLAVAELVALQD